MNDLSIRATTAADVDTWRALRLDGIVRHPQAFMITAEAARDMPVEKDAAALQELHRWLAYVGDTPVGFVGLHPNRLARAEHRAEIGPLYVFLFARGHGVALALVRHAIAFGRDMGVWQFELFVNDQNLPARHLYARLGFTEAGAIPNAIIGAEGPERDILMIRVDPA